MIDILWGSLALCALGLGLVSSLLLLSARENLVKTGQALDILNRELPGILKSARSTVEDAEAVAGGLRQVTRAAVWAGGLFKAIRVVSGLFGAVESNGGRKHSSEVHHD